MGLDAGQDPRRALLERVLLAGKQTVHAPTDGAGVSQFRELFE